MKWNNCDEVYTLLTKYKGPKCQGVDPSTLEGKIVSGYQGWFNAPKDGAGMGWNSWDRKGVFEPGSCTIDLWPDLSEFDEDEKYLTDFRTASKEPTHVYSAHNKKSVLRHFKWMKEYGIDGAFVQRFVGPLKEPTRLHHSNKVLENCREGANTYGRTYNVMYDLSGITSSDVQIVIKDWKNLVDKMGITRGNEDGAYQHHNGKPLVTIWGVGFCDGRHYTLEDCMELVKFFKEDPVYGGNAVMLGVPTGWREQSLDHFYVPRVEERHIVMDGDCVQNLYLHDVIEAADIVSPWSVDRFIDLEGASYIAEHIWKKDIKWCEEKGIEFMPVVFPGFSWGNLYSGQAYNQIPRREGTFLWRQLYEAVNLGSKMIYQAMFDEVNEATAIFKCTNDVPVGGSQFVTYEGLPSDYYLRLLGQGGKMLRKEIRLSKEIPHI